MIRLGKFSVLVIFLLIASACSPAAQTQALPSQQPITGSSQPTPGDTLTPLPSATVTVTSTPSPTPTPTAVPILTINPQTMGQLRLLWSMNASGSGSSMTFLQCQSASCDMLTRIGAYAFSPDDTLLAVGVCKGSPTQDNSHGTGKLYSCTAGGEVQLYPAFTGGSYQSLAVDGFPRALAFDPTGKTLAVGTSDGKIDLWDLASMQMLRTLQHPSKRTGVISLAFSPDGTLLISQGDGQVVVWDWAQGTNLKAMPGYGPLAFDPSGEHLVASWYDNSAAVIARIYDLVHLGQMKDVRAQFVQPNMFNEAIRAAFSPDGQKLVIIGANGAEWWDAQGTKMEGHTDVGQLVQTNQAAAFTATGIFLPDGQVLTEQGLGISAPGMPIPMIGLGGTIGCGFVLWDPMMPGAYSISNPPGGCQAPTASGDSSRVVVSPDGALAAADDSAGNLRVWGVDATAAPLGPTCLGTCQ